MVLNTFKIKKHIAKERLTIRDFAEIVGMSRQNMGAILARGKCSLANAGRIADAMGVSLEEICEDGEVA